MIADRDPDARPDQHRGWAGPYADYDLNPADQRQPGTAGELDEHQAAGHAVPGAGGCLTAILFLVAFTGWWDLPGGILAATAALVTLVVPGSHRRRGWWLLAMATVTLPWWVAFEAIAITFHGWAWSV